MKYGIWSDDVDSLLNGLDSQTAWSSFTNGITGATATGAPTGELFENSYNIKYSGTDIDYTSSPNLSASIDDYNLYVPHTSTYFRLQWILVGFSFWESLYLWCGCWW